MLELRGWATPNASRDTSTSHWLKPMQGPAHATHGHWPHLDHGPLLLTGLLADAGDGVAVTVHPKVEDSIDRLLVCQSCFT